MFAALAVGQHFGVSLEEGVAAIEAYIPSNNRSQMTKTERNTLIVDAYNANPTSMAAAIENFSNVEAACKVALLGDMLELGEESMAEHVALIRSVASRGLAKVCFVGKEFMKASAEAGLGDCCAAAYDSAADVADGVAASDIAGGVLFFETSDALAQWLHDNPVDGATVLIKGSRGTRMEKTIAEL